MCFRPKVVKQNNQKRGILCTQGELLLEDLPPIEDLYISVPEEQAHPIGTVFSIVEQQGKYAFVFFFKLILFSSGFSLSSEITFFFSPLL